MNLVEKSYISHKKNLESFLKEIEEDLNLIEQKDSANYKVIERILDILKPFQLEQKSWLTIGDYSGLEANYLSTNGQRAIASDLSDAFLKGAKIKGLIEDYAIVNVEHIQFEENYFDYALCKMSFHHFPKAYLGLYEMIRVSKNAAIIIEPIDILQKLPLVLLVKNLLDRINPYLINKIWKNRFSFETVGNYVFKVSEREIEKIAMGMGLPCIAFKGINTLLNLGFDKALLNETPTNKRIWKIILRKLFRLNFLCKLHILPDNHLCCVVFKTSPSVETRLSMKENGFKILDLPKNPYLNY